MNFIKHRASLDDRIDDLIESRERVFNETLHDMLQAAVANYTGKDNSDGPTLPKTPSTCRRLRSRQPKKRKQQQTDLTQNDGSPQLSKALQPLDNISNTMENTDDQMIGTVRKSSRKCAVKATQAISELTGRKKGSNGADKQEQEVKKILSSVADDEATCYNEEPMHHDQDPMHDDQNADQDPPMQHDQTLTSHNDESTPPPIDQSLTPLVVNDTHPVPSPVTQTVTESGCLNETKTLHVSASQEDFTSSDEDKYSTPPSNVSTGVAGMEPKPADDIRRVTTIIKRCPEPQATTNQVIVNNGPCVDLALLTKLTPQPDKSADVAQTPATVIKDCCNDTNVNICTSTVIKGHPTNSRIVVETPATITKSPSNSNDAEEQNDGSPEFAVTGKPQESFLTVSSASAITSSTTTKKQITPTNAFSPAKLKSTVPLEPSGLLYSNHAPSKAGLGGIKKLAHKEKQMLKAKERLAEKNRRDKERLELLEKKKEQERLEKKRRNEEQLRKVQERQALLLKKKEAQKMQMQQRILTTEPPEEVKTKATEKPLSEMPKYDDQGRKLREDFHASPIWESDEENYWEEEKQKRDNCTSHEDYNYYVEKEMEKAKLAKTRMCSVDKIATTISSEAVPQSTYLYSNHDNCIDDDDGDYGLEDLHSDDSTDEEDEPRKPVPPWAQENNLIPIIERQEERPLNASMAVFSRETDPVNLGRIFKHKKHRFFKRTSSAQWSSPPTKANNGWIV